MAFESAGPPQRDNEDFAVFQRGYLAAHRWVALPEGVRWMSVCILSDWRSYVTYRDRGTLRVAYHDLRSPAALALHDFIFGMAAWRPRFILGPYDFVPHNVKFL